MKPYPPRPERPKLIGGGSRHIGGRAVRLPDHGKQRRPLGDRGRGRNHRRAPARLQSRVRCRFPRPGGSHLSLAAGAGHGPDGGPAGGRPGRGCRSRDLPAQPVARRYDGHAGGAVRRARPARPGHRLGHDGANPHRFARGRSAAHRDRGGRTGRRCPAPLHPPRVHHRGTRQPRSGLPLLARTTQLKPSDLGGRMVSHAVARDLGWVGERGYFAAKSTRMRVSSSGAEKNGEWSVAISAVSTTADSRAMRRCSSIGIALSLVQNTKRRVTSASSSIWTGSTKGRAACGASMLAAHCCVSGSHSPYSTSAPASALSVATAGSPSTTMFCWTPSAWPSGSAARSCKLWPFLGRKADTYTTWETLSAQSAAAWVMTIPPMLCPTSTAGSSAELRIAQIDSTYLARVTSATGVSSSPAPGRSGALTV